MKLFIFTVWIMNLTITKTRKLKKQKDTVSNVYKHWLCYLFRLLTFQTSFKNSFQTKNMFQIFKVFNKSLWNKGQSKTKTEKNDEHNCLIGFFRRQFLDGKAKTRGTALNILLVLWKLLRCWYTACFCEKCKVVKVV